MKCINCGFESGITGLFICTIDDSVLCYKCADVESKK